MLQGTHKDYFVSDTDSLHHICHFCLNTTLRIMVLFTYLYAALACSGRNKVQAGFFGKSNNITVSYMEPWNTETHDIDKIKYISYILNDAMGCLAGLKLCSELKS